MLGGCDYSLRGQTRESAQESGKQGYLYWQALGLVGNPISLNNMDVLPRTYPTINLKIPHTFAPTIVPTHMKTCMHTHKHENGKRQKRRGKTYWIPTTYTLCRDTEMVITWSLLAQKFISLITSSSRIPFVAVYKILNKYKQPLLQPSFRSHRIS